MDRINEYLQYHRNSSYRMDIDIQVEAIEFICAIKNIPLEGKLWLSFLFSCTYCMATAWVIFSRFPEFKGFHLAVLEKFWEQNRQKLIFQSDRVYVKNCNKFVAMVASYRDFIKKHDAGENQHSAIVHYLGGAKGGKAYRRLVDSGLYFFGRFSWFLYSELLSHCGIDVEAELDLADAKSVRNGLCFAAGLDDAYVARNENGSVAPEKMETLNNALQKIVCRVAELPILQRHKSLWSIETTLCAFKKHILGKRYVGYYVERMIDEGEKMRERFPGVDWTPMQMFVDTFYGGGAK